MPTTGTRPARRADARQNVESILEATVDCLSLDSDASVSEIAKTAGVGRVTVYAHFPSREALIEAAMVRMLADGDEVLEGIDLTGEPRDALRLLIESSWLLTARASAVLEAAQASMSADRILALHEKPQRRVDDLIRRGQEAGVFRTDLPASWLSGVMHHVMKGAASDVAGGRLDVEDAPHFIAETVLGAYADTGR